MAAENVVLCLETKKYRYYYDMILGNNFIVYFVYYTRRRGVKKIQGYVGLSEHNQLLFSQTPKVGYKKVVPVHWDSIATSVFEATLK